MTRRAHRAWRRAWLCALVLGLTPRLVSAAPPDPDSSEQSPSVAPQPGEADPPRSYAPAVVTGTVALASLTTAVVFTIRSSMSARSLSADLVANVQYDSDDRRLAIGRRDAIIASTLYGATAVVGALTLYYVLRRVGPRRSSASAWQLGPSFDRHGGSLALTVGF